MKSIRTGIVDPRSAGRDGVPISFWDTNTLPEFILPSIPISRLRWRGLRRTQPQRPTRVAEFGHSANQFAK